MRSLSLFLALFLGPALGATASCTRDDGKSTKLQVPVIAITACPKGALLDGAAPPAGLRQRCQKDESTRHGASREWWEDGRERAYSEWWEGEKHGRFALWFKDGRPRAEGAHRFGVPAGKWTYRGEDGKVMQQETFPVAPPDPGWVAQAIAGKEPVRDMPPTDMSTEGPGAGGISSPVNDGVPPPPAKVPAVKNPYKDAMKAPAPAYTPAPTDPVFERGAPSN